MKAKYIDKTFPITLQDLIDLAKSENKDPRDLKLIMNSNSADLASYVQCALLNQDCDKISIELYTSAEDGFDEDTHLFTQNKQKSKPKSPSPNNTNNKDLPRFDKAFHILNGIYDLVNDLIDDQNAKVEIKQVNDSDISLLTDALQIIQGFTLKQTTII